MCQGYRSSRKHDFQTTLEIGFRLMRPTRVSTDVFPHDVYHSGADQAVLYNEGKQVGCCVLDYSTHDVDTATGVCYHAILRQSFRINTKILIPVIACVRRIINIKYFVHL